MTISKNTLATQALGYWSLMTVLIAFACMLVLLGGSTALWAAPVSISVYSAGAWFLLSRSKARLTQLTPLSWSLLISFLQLVIIPLLILLGEPAMGTLRILPSDAAMNQGLLLSTFAFGAFVMGFHLYNRSDAKHRTNVFRAWEWNPPLSVVGCFLGIGVLGFYLYSFEVPNLSILLDPKLAKQVARSNETGLAEAAATILRPFMTAGLVLLWIRLMHSGACRQIPAKLAVTAVISAFVVLAMSTYSFNRASFVVPIIAMAAVLTNRYRVPVALFWIAALVSIVPLWVVGSFRKNGTQASDFIVLMQSFSSNEPVRQLSEGVQLYGNGPQFLGYMLEQRSEMPLYWGSTLVSSVISPIPVLGRTFRDTSGTALYNYMIYGSTVSQDQIVPFSGELLMNFHLPGVFAGFLALGACLAWVHRKFRDSLSPVDSYFFQYSGMWLTFLITGSLAVISQIAIYMCLPMYAWFLVRRTMIRKRSRFAFSPAIRYRMAATN